LFPKYRCSSSKPANRFGRLDKTLTRQSPAAIGIGPLRTAALVWSTLMFGSLAVLNVYTQVQNLLR
jgi:hypothetical protein